MHVLQTCAGVTIAQGNHAECLPEGAFPTAAAEPIIKNLCTYLKARQDFALVQARMSRNDLAHAATRRNDNVARARMDNLRANLTAHNPDRTLAPDNKKRPRPE